MGYLQKAKAANAIHNGSVVTAAPRATGHLETNHILIDTYPINTGNISYLSSRFDDPRYYTGDTAN